LNRYEKVGKLNDDDFKQIIGVKKKTFEAMAEVLRGLMHKSTNAGAGTQSCR
jgi:hypothetical protein